MSRVSIVMPPGDPEFGGHRRLLEIERGELQSLLRAPVEVVDADECAGGTRWLLERDAAAASPTLTYDPAAALLVSRAADDAGLLETFSLLPTLLRQGGGCVAAVAAVDVDDAIERVRVEVADTYPSFSLRGIDWDRICERHVEAVRQCGGSVAAFQRWLAELDDGHTWIAETPRPRHLPYVVKVSDGKATFARVPSGTAAAAAGVAAGWSLVAIDDSPVDLREWWLRTGAPPHAKPYIVGRRLLAGAVGQRRALIAQSPAGRSVAWEERIEQRPPEPLVAHRRLSPRVGYVRVAAWIADCGFEALLDAALLELEGCDRLVFDIRDNVGGNLVLAYATRDRFVREETRMGTIRYTAGAGELSAPFPIDARPTEDRVRWNDELVVLTNPLTYSASEDFLLGLQGLDHVRVVGEPTGGGSGRPRTVRLLREADLLVSTALTYDRNSRCIEGAGIPVDIDAPQPAAFDGDLALATAVAL